MFSINYNTKNPLQLFAISHFIEKTGIPFSENCNKKASLVINYGKKGEGDFLINIPKKKESESLRGNICHNCLKLPLFQPREENCDSESTIPTEYVSDNEKSPSISRSGNTINYNYDIFREVGYLLSGQYEIVHHDEEKLQNSKIFKTPVADHHEELLLKSIITGCEYLNIPLVRKSYWPYDKKFAVCLTHDVDEFKKTYQWITKSVRAIKNRNYSAFKNQIRSLYYKIQGKEPYWTFEEIMELEKKYGVKSTYYFLIESSKRSLFKPENWHLYGRCHSLQKPCIKKLIKELNENGHEIGLHGSTFSYNSPEILKEQKKEIEQISGAKIHGIRQHRLNMNIPATWEHQAEAGLLYDTSLGYKAAEDPGFRFGTCFPFHPIGTENKPIKILEIPLSVMDVSLSPGKKGWNQVEEVVNIIEKFNGALTLLWHPPVFNPLEYPLLGEYYKYLIEMCKEKNAWIATGYEIASWWKRREEDKISLNKDDKQISIISSGERNIFLDIYCPDKNYIKTIKGDAKILSANKNLSKLRINENTEDNKIFLEIL